MSDAQKIHPLDVEAASPPPTFPRGLSSSDKGHPYPYSRRTIPVKHTRPPRHRRSCCCRCICCTFLLLILLVVFVAATLGALYLVYRPKLPKYSVDSLRVAVFGVNNNLTARATFDVTVTAENPNKGIGIEYVHGSSLRVLYGGSYVLCRGELPEFYQGHRNTTVLTVAMRGEVELASAAAQELQKQEKEAAVPLEFSGDVPVRVKLGALKLWKVTAKVRCDLVVDSLTASDSIKIKSNSCKFRLKL